MTIEPTRRSTTRGRPRVTTGHFQCSRCDRMVNTLRASWPGEQLCHSCFYAAMRTLDDVGLANDTIVVFTSDNGADTSTLHKRGSSGPWTGTMFTPMEGSNRVPFIIRWPGRVPADRETDAIVHEVDTFTTLLRLVGADIPEDRPIDGVDQRDLLLGSTETSARGGFPIFFGEKLYAAKWRNYKLHFVWQVNATDPVQTLGVPYVFNLLTNTRTRTPMKPRHHPPVGRDGSLQNDRHVPDQPQRAPANPCRCSRPLCATQRTHPSFRPKSQLSEYAGLPVTTAYYIVAQRFSAPGSRVASSLLVMRMGDRPELKSRDSREVRLDYMCRAATHARSRSTLSASYARAAARSAAATAPNARAQSPSNGNCARYRCALRAVTASSG